jgi:hypothetical protein
VDTVVEAVAEAVVETVLETQVGPSEVYRSWLGAQI